MGFIDSFFAVLLKVEPAWQNIRFSGTMLLQPQRESFISFLSEEVS